MKNRYCIEIDNYKFYYSFDSHIGFVAYCDSFVDRITGHTLEDLKINIKEYLKTLNSKLNFYDNDVKFIDNDYENKYNILKNKWESLKNLVNDEVLNLMLEFEKEEYNI
jgi:hypothetical protein